jgi:hypothetical protein
MTRNERCFVGHLKDRARSRKRITLRRPFKDYWMSRAGLNRLVCLLALAACGGSSGPPKETAIGSQGPAAADTPKAHQPPSESYTPPNGFVPDSLTAVRIAVAVWTPIYGEKPVRDEAPYHATLRDGVWTVEGSFNCERACGGGVAVAEIAKGDGRILRVIHGQ